MMIAMLGPIDLSTEPVALTCLAYLTTVELTRIGIAIRIYQFEGHDGWKLQFRPSVVFFTVVMLWLVYDLISLPSDGTLSYATLMVISFLALTGFVIPIVAIYSAFFVATMWFASSTYFKAALVTLTFLLTLELLCLVPLVRDWVELFVDWIDPRGTTAPLPMLPGL